MIRGLSMNRDENKPPAEYFRREEEEEVGLITYTPMYLTYDNEAFINPETNKTIYKGYEKMVLRVLLLVKSPVRLVVSEFPVSE